MSFPPAPRLRGAISSPRTVHGAVQVTISSVQLFLHDLDHISITGFSILGMLIGLQYLEVEALSQNKKKN